MFGSKKQDLSSAENVKKGQKVYDRIKSGKTKDARGELDKAYGKKK